LSEEIEPYRLHLSSFWRGRVNSEQEHKYYTKASPGNRYFGADVCDEKHALASINALTGKIGKLMHDFRQPGYTDIRGMGRPSVLREEEKFYSWLI